MSELEILTFEELREANVMRCEEVFHPVNDWSPTDWATAMAGECGEACNEVKKLRRLDGADSNPDSEVYRDTLRRLVGFELADLIIYADLLAARLDLNLSAFIKEKFNEVSEKRGSKVTLPLDVCSLSEDEEDELIKKAQGAVRSVLKGERVGFNNALHWAANWVESSAEANGNPAVIEFAKNMAMSIRANRRKNRS